MYYFVEKYMEINDVFLTQNTDLSKSKEEKKLFEDLFKAQEQKNMENEKLSEEIVKKNEMIVSLSNEVSSFI